MGRYWFISCVFFVALLPGYGLLDVAARVVAHRLRAALPCAAVLLVDRAANRHKADAALKARGPLL